MSKAYQDVYYQSNDNLTLYARDYENAHAKKTIICMHGFTRNSADFEPLALCLVEKYRMIVPDLRGRGLSEYDSNTANYNPAKYIEDMFRLIQVLDLEEVHIVGTSLGAVIGLSMAAMQPETVKSVVLNDLGPKVDGLGLKRILESMGIQPKINSWDDAVAHLKKINGFVYPGFTEEQWMGYTGSVFKENDVGVPVSTLDPGVSELHKDFDVESSPMDLWPVFHSASACSFLVIRGEISDVFTQSCFEELQQFDNVLNTYEVPRVGHAPLLDDEPTIAVISEFFNNV